MRSESEFFRHSSFREENVWAAASVRKLPDGVPWQAAVCLDPTDFALGAVRDGHVRIGDAVAVFGLGGIGLMAMQLAKLAGAYPVIGVDPLELRRNVALECGADIVIDSATVDAGLEIKRLPTSVVLMFALNIAVITWHYKRLSAAWLI